MSRFIPPYRLLESRKGDREKMAQEVEALAKRMGWDCARCEHMPLGDIRVSMHGPKGLSVSIEFERRTTQANLFCLPWHFTYTGDKDAKLSDAFGRYQGSPFDNYHHRRKCTAFASGIDTLLDKLLVAMEMANGTSAYGSAFMEADHA